jgi:hypothetical protein
LLLKLNIKTLGKCQIKCLNKTTELFSEEETMFDFLGKFPELFGNALASDFTHNAAIFALAALVHASQVRREIKFQFGELVSVIKQDLEAQKSVLAGLTARVDKLEGKIEGSNKAVS